MFELEGAIPNPAPPILGIIPDEAGDSWHVGVGAAEFPVVRSQLCIMLT